METPKRSGQILVVDDDATMRGLIENLLAEQGFGVTTAISGEEAIRSFENRDFDCVILDYNLSGWLNGCDLYKELTAVIPGVPVIMLTSHNSEELRREVLAAGVFAFWTKPIESLDGFLEDVIRASLSGSQRAKVSERENLRLQFRADRLREGRIARSQAKTLKHAFHSLPNEQAIYELLLDEAVRACDAERAIAGRWNSESGRLEIVSSRGLPADSPLEIPIQAGAGPLGWVLSHRVPLMEDDLTAERLKDHQAWLNPRLVIALPIVSDSAILGILIINNTEQGLPPVRDTFELLCDLATWASGGLLSGRLL